MLRFVLSAACLVAASPVFAQTSGSPEPQAPASAEPQQAIQVAALAFGQCVQSGVQAAPANGTAEAAAAAVLGACSSQKQQLEQAAQTYIAAMPESDRPGAQEMLRSRLAEAETQIAAMIRQRRTAAPAEAAAAQ